MTEYNVARSTHRTLSPSQVDTVTFSAPYSSVTVINRGVVPLFATTDGVDPAVGQDDTFVLLPGMIVELPVAPSTTPVSVKLISPGATAYSATVDSGRVISNGLGGSGGGDGTSEFVTPDGIGAIAITALGIPSGVATLDTDGINAQAPKVHTHPEIVTTSDVLCE